MSLLHSIGLGIAYSIIWSAVLYGFILILAWVPWLILVFLLSIPLFLGGRGFWLDKKNSRSAA